MRALNALVTREANAQRGLVVAAALLAPSIVLACHYSELVDLGSRDAATVSLLIPAAVVLLMLALVVDAFTRDFGSTIGDTLSRLPLRDGLNMLAKGIWLGSVAVALYAWTFIIEGRGKMSRGGIGYSARPRKPQFGGDWPRGSRSLASVVPGRGYERTPTGVVLQHDLDAAEVLELYSGSPDRPQSGHGLSESPDGSLLLVTGPVGERLVYIDTATGALVAELPGGWSHGGWTGGTNPVAFLRKRTLGYHKTSPVQLLGPDGLREVVVEPLDSLQCIEEGRFLALSRGSMWIVDKNVNRLRPVYLRQTSR